jgi:hypothetical protein
MPRADHRVEEYDQQLGVPSLLPIPPRPAHEWLRATAVPGWTISPSFRNSEFFPNVIARPNYASLKVIETFFNTLPLDHQPGEVRPRNVLRKFFNEPAGFFFDMRSIFHINDLFTILPHT